MKALPTIFGARPDAAELAPIALAHGDATTARAAGLAAFYARVPAGPSVLLRLLLSETISPVG